MSEPILPIPCTKVKEKTVKDWVQKINEELDELKLETFSKYYFEEPVDSPYVDIQNKLGIVEEAADTITAITSMLEAMGIDEKMRQAAQRRVNEKNKERGRF